MAGVVGVGCDGAGSGAGVVGETGPVEIEISAQFQNCSADQGRIYGKGECFSIASVTPWRCFLCMATKRTWHASPIGWYALADSSSSLEGTPFFGIRITRITSVGATVGRQIVPLQEDKVPG